MVNKCCVRNCKSNYGSNFEKAYVTCFKFPTDKTLRGKMVKKNTRRRT